MQEVDGRWRMLRYVGLVTVVVWMASTPVLGAGAPAAASADGSTAAEEPAAEDGASAAAPVDPMEGAVEAGGGLTWQLLSHEYCLDRFGTTCPNGATSADPCPVSNPQGKSCSTAGDRCWYVLSTWWADEYRCS